MKISTSSAKEGVILIEIEGELDAYTARNLDRRLDELITDGQGRLVLDTTRMGFISSAGVRSILFAQRELDRRGGQLRVCGLNAQARRVFEIAGFDEVLHFSDNLQEALEGW